MKHISFLFLAAVFTALLCAASYAQEKKKCERCVKINGCSTIELKDGRTLILSTTGKEGGHSKIQTKRITLDGDQLLMLSEGDGELVVTGEGEAADCRFLVEKGEAGLILRADELALATDLEEHEERIIRHGDNVIVVRGTCDEPAPPAPPARPAPPDHHDRPAPPAHAAVKVRPHVERLAVPHSHTDSGELHDAVNDLHSELRALRKSIEKLRKRVEEIADDEKSVRHTAPVRLERLYGEEHEEILVNHIGEVIGNLGEIVADVGVHCDGVVDCRVLNAGAGCMSECEDCEVICEVECCDSNCDSCDTGCEIICGIGCSGKNCDGCEDACIDCDCDHCEEDCGASCKTVCKPPKSDTKCLKVKKPVKEQRKILLSSPLPGKKVKNIKNIDFRAAPSRKIKEAHI